VKHVAAIRRLWLAHVVLFPVQRWFGGAAAALILLGLIFPAQLGWGWLAAFCFVVTVAMPAGWIFRVLSARRTSRLLPYFRPRMLAAVALVILAVALVVAELFVDSWIVFSAPRPILRPTFAEIAVLIAVAASVWFWFVFFAPRSVIAIVLLALPYRFWVIWVAPRYSGSFGLVVRIEHVIWTLIALWAAFCIWYLAAPPVKPFTRRRTVVGQIP
jgi:hypothetical protein